MDWQAFFSGMNRRSRRAVGVVLGILVLLIAARIAAPFVIEWKVNRELSQHPTYDGYVTDVDLFLIIGRVDFEGVYIERKGGEDRPPLLEVASLEVDYRWTDLFEGELVADVHIERPQLNLVPAATRERRPKDQIEKSDEGSILALTAEELFPAKINRLTARHGKVRFRDGDARPKVDIALSDLSVEARNLNNRPSPDHKLPASARARGVIQKSGDLVVRLALNPFAEKATFDLEIELEGLALTELKDFTRAYADVDIEDGVAHFYAEAAAADGKIRGYVKPMIQGSDVLEWKGGDEEDSVPQKMWEGAVGGVKELLEDDDKDRAASRVPFQGKLDKPGADLWAAVVELLINAFIEPLLADVDATITLRDVL